MKREKSEIKIEINQIYDSKHNLMIQDERLGGKHIILPEIAIKMMQLIAGFNAFYFAISKTIIHVQEANSPYSIAILSQVTKKIKIE